MSPIERRKQAAEKLDWQARCRRLEAENLKIAQNLIATLEICAGISDIVDAQLNDLIHADEKATLARCRNQALNQAAALRDIYPYGAN